MSRGAYWHVYSRWSRLLHRLNLHRTRTIGPLEPGGGYVTRCDWCGLSGKRPRLDTPPRPPLMTIDDGYGNNVPRPGQKP